MKIATLTPTRGSERKILFDFCKKQIDIQTVQPDNRYYMAFDPLDNSKDLTRRVRQGWELAKRHHVDWIVIMEDDDSYQPDHIENYSRYFEGYDFIGDQHTSYYNITTHRWQTFHHPGRASLFTTAFRVSALNDFEWPQDDYVFLDLKLWKHASKYKCKYIRSGAVGIKGHGKGLTGGKGHKQMLTKDDSDLKFLKQNVGREQFEFYKDLMKTL